MKIRNSFCFYLLSKILFFYYVLNAYDPVDLQRLLDGGKSLVGADLSGADLQGKTFCRTNLNGANLNGSNLKNSTWEFCSFNKADMSKVIAENANFFSCMIYKAHCSEAFFMGAKFRKETDRYSWMVTTLFGSDLRKANLCDADLSKTDLCNVKFNRVVVTKNTNLKGADLRDLQVESVWWCDELECIIVPSFVLLNLRFDELYDSETFDEIFDRVVEEVEQEDYGREIIVQDFENEKAELPGNIFNKDKCFICLDEYEEGSKIAVFRCGHTFHKHCANMALSTYLPFRQETKLECPVCRRFIDRFKSLKISDFQD